MQFVIDYEFAKKFNQKPCVSVTSATVRKSSRKYDLDSFGTGVEKVLKYFSKKQQNEINEILPFHLFDVDGVNLYQLDRTKYHLKNNNVEYAKDTFGWGFLDSDNDNDFLEVFNKCLSDEDYFDNRCDLVANKINETVDKYKNS